MSRISLVSHSSKLFSQDAKMLTQALECMQAVMTHIMHLLLCLIK
jgi:hypothetical protein